MADYKMECVLDAKAELGECPIWSVEDQCLYWIDIDGKTFNRFDPASGRNKVWTLPDLPGSFVLRERGGAVIAMRTGLYDFDFTTGDLRHLVDAPYDADVFRFNDGRTDRQGRFWVGSIPIDFMNAGENRGAYYCYDGVSLDMRIAPIEGANGTAFSPDGGTMYRAETMQRRIFAYEIAEDGQLSGERLFATPPDGLGMPDGATIDSEGGYWVALPGGSNGGGVGRFTPDGKFDLHIDVPVLVSTMPAFGGPDMTTLYVTTGRLEHMLGKQPSEFSGGIFAVETPFQGIKETPFKVARG